jgi:hypothetical protein
MGGTTMQCAPEPGSSWRPQHRLRNMSALDSDCILRLTWPRWTLIVFTAVPNSAAI